MLPSLKLRGDACGAAVQLELARVFCRTVAPAGKHGAVARHSLQQQVVTRVELALVIALREFHAVNRHAAAPAHVDAHVHCILQAKVLLHFLAYSLGAVLGILNKVATVGRPTEIALVARPSLLVTLLLARGNCSHHLLHLLLHIFVGQVVVEQYTCVVDEQALEIVVVEKFVEHLRGALLCAAKTPTAADIPAAHAGELALTRLLLAGVLLAALLAVVPRGRAQRPLEHVLALHVKPADARRETESVIGIECDKLERIAVAAPGADVVFGPVAVVEVEFGEHVLREAVHVDLLLHLFVTLVVVARKVAAGNLVRDLLVLGGRCPVRTARLGTVALDVNHVDGLAVDTVVRLDKAPVQALAQIVDAEVFTVVEHHHLQAALVIHVGAFHEARHHGIADVVRPEAVAVVSQVEALHLLRFGARLEEGVLEHLVSVVVVIHLDGDTLLGLVAAPVTDKRNARVDFPRLFGGGTALLEVFHVYGEFVFAPEVRLEAGLGTLGIVVVGLVAAHAHLVEVRVRATELVHGAGRIKTVGGVEHVVVIHGERYHRHRDVFADKVGLRCGIGGLAVHELATAHHGAFGNLHRRGNLLGTLRGE